MKKHFTCFLLFPTLAFAQIPTGYYDGTSGLSGYELKSKLHEIISKKIYSHHYSDVVGLYANTDLDHYYENDETILDIYSENPTGPDAYNYDLTQNISSANAEGLGWNREHGMPQSTFYSLYPMYSDLHYLIPTDARINQLRSNYPYARTTGLDGGNSHNCNSPNTTPCIASNGSKLGFSITPGYTARVYEPIDEFKGDVARYLLYFVVRYEGSLYNYNYLLSTSPLDGNEERGYEDWYITMLKDWNALDPVSQKEINRNNAVYAIENVRNPFIDHPEFVNMIWSETPDSTAPQTPTSLSAAEIGESFVKLQWQPSPDSDILGYRIYQDTKYIGYTKSNTFFADRLSPSTTYNFTVKSYDKGYLESPETSPISATTMASDNLAKDLMITKYIEGSGNNKAVEITNKTGHEVKLTNYFISIQFFSGSNYYFGENYQLEGSLLPGESKVIINLESAFPNFNVSNGDFITNAPSMTFSGTHYIELAYGTKYLDPSTNNYKMSYTTVDGVGIKNTSNSNGNKSLYRNSDVIDPNVNFTISEWTEYPSNYTTGLGEDFLATNENIIENNFTIVPNPVKDILTIQGSGFKNSRLAEIYDISGKIVKTFSGNSTDVSDLQKGIYILKVNNQTLKFIKK
ncbi:MAG: endonuclease [Flavobacteriaceae bacterium]|jgi:endonuclease I|nr:endonuclease [Flavobacteriaceae bacterium]